MSNGKLLNHCGAREVTLNELAVIEAPPATDTWFPISHFDVFRTVSQTLRSAGYEVGKQRFSLSQENHRFFGVLDLASRIAEGVNLSIGIRNSTDKSFPIGLVGGSRVFVCDNLAFHGEIYVAKRHTRFGQDRYEEGIATAIASLSQYQKTQGEWINRLRSREFSRQETDALLLRAYEEDVVGARQLPLLIQEVRHPSHEEFKEPTAWSLYNCFTSVLNRTMQTQPAKHALTTIRLQRIFEEREVIDVEFTRNQQATLAV
jgi:hypothetical protein